MGGEYALSVTIFDGVVDSTTFYDFGSRDVVRPYIDEFTYNSYEYDVIMVRLMKDQHTFYLANDTQNLLAVSSIIAAIAQCAKNAAVGTSAFTIKSVEFHYIQ